LGGFAFAVAKNHGWRSFEEDGHKKSVTDAVTSPTVKLTDAVDLRQLKKPIPKGKLGGHEIGRIICGGNLISGFGHSRDLIYVSQFLKNYFMKTLHSRNYWSWNPEQKKDKRVIENYGVDNYWERTPEETIAYMESLNKPWIAFKTLAAGAVHPKAGFRYAFENGADFVCAGMFDYQVVEDANILTGILDSPGFKRKRVWIA
jgi:hypothetical protein